MKFRLSMYAADASRIALEEFEARNIGAACAAVALRFPPDADVVEVVVEEVGEWAR